MADRPDQVTTKGQMTKWEQIYNPPEWLNKGPVTLERGANPVQGGEVADLGNNTWRISFPGGGGGGGGGGSSVYATEAGMIMAWPKAVANEAEDLPAGWMVCDGRQLAISEYEALWEVIGHTYTPSGEISGDPTLFRIPDYRGRTLIGTRVQDDGAAWQPQFGGNTGLYEQEPSFDGAPGEGRVDVNDGAAEGGVGTLQKGFNVKSDSGSDSEVRPIPPNTAVTWVIKTTSTFDGVSFDTRVVYKPGTETDLTLDGNGLTLSIGNAPWEIVQEYEESYTKVVTPQNPTPLPPPPLNTLITLLPWQAAHERVRVANYLVHTVFYGGSGRYAAYLEVKTPEGVILDRFQHWANMAYPEGHWGDVSHGCTIIPAGHMWRLCVEYYRHDGKNHRRHGYVVLQAPPKLSLKLRDELIPAEENEAT